MKEGRAPERVDPQIIRNLEREYQGLERGIPERGAPEDHRNLAQESEQSLETLERAQGTAAKVQAAMDTMKVARRLRGAIQGAGIPITTYTFMLFLAILKDSLDIALVEAHSLVDWIVDVVLLVMLVQFLLKRLPWKIKIRFVFGGVGEVIPIIGGLPLWTGLVITAFIYETRRKARLGRLQDRLEGRLAKSVQNLKRSASTT